MAEEVFEIAGRDPLIEVAIKLQVGQGHAPWHQARCWAPREWSAAALTLCHQRHKPHRTPMLLAQPRVTSLSPRSPTTFPLNLNRLTPSPPTPSKTPQDYALADEYFVSRKLYPNVDFYSGLVYRAMGFPPQFFTVLFAIPRCAAGVGGDQPALAWAGKS